MSETRGERQDSERKVRKREERVGGGDTERREVEREGEHQTDRGREVG